MIYIAPKTQRESGRIGKVLRAGIGRLEIVCLQKAWKARERCVMESKVAE